MERNRPVTTFGAVVIALICAAGVLAGFAMSPEHPIRTSLLTVGVVLGGLLAIVGLNLVTFAPLLALMTRFLARRAKKENAEPAPPPCSEPAARPSTPKKHLPGAATEGQYAAVDGDGRSVELHTACFPIVKQGPEGRCHLVGTGFYISSTGLFLTAKHVLMDVLGPNGRQEAPIVIFHFLSGGGYVIRPIVRCTTHPLADIAVGVAAGMSSPMGEPLRSKMMALYGGDVSEGEEIATYAYPASVMTHSAKPELHFHPVYYPGKLVKHHREGRDRSVLPGPCAQTSMVIHGGASGGPVFVPGRGVYAVNSTGIGQEPISYITPIHTVRRLLIDDVVSPVSNANRKARVDDLIRAGFIAWRE